MKTARIERMTRELQAEPAEQFVESLLKVAERLWPKNGVRAKTEVSYSPSRPVEA
jgi:hypothetical protein